MVRSCAASAVESNTQTSLVGVQRVRSPRNRWGVKSKIERLPEAMKMKLAELISVARKDWEAFEVVDFWRSLGIYSVFILEDKSLLISA